MRQQKLYKRCARFASGLLTRRRFSRIAIVSLCMLFAFMLDACTATTPTNTSANAASVVPTVLQTSAPGAPTSPQTSASVVPASSQTAAVDSSTGYPVKVYFSHLPQSNSNFSAVFPVNRVSPTSGVSTFAIQQLVAGPTASESAFGYVSELKNHLSGVSSCPASASFTLKLNTKGTISAPGTATLRFCRQFSSPGIGVDARTIAEVNATLKQFTSIKKVVILTKDGHCFGDGSGADICLN